MDSFGHSVSDAVKRGRSTGIEVGSPKPGSIQIRRRLLDAKSRSAWFQGVRLRYGFGLVEKEPDAGRRRFDGDVAQLLGVSAEKTGNTLELAEIDCENRGHDRKPFVLESHARELHCTRC